MLVPVMMLLIGLSLTALNFREEAQVRSLVSQNYLWKQRLLVGSNLIKPSNMDDHDDFEDEEWPYPIDIQPSEIISNLPEYAKNAYEIELYDTRPDLEAIWAKETLNRQKWYENNVTYAREEYENAYEKTML